MKTTFTIICGLATACALGQTAEQGPLSIPGSLFSAQSGEGVIVNRIAHHKGDLLTIVVNENTTGTTTATTTSSKQDSTTVSPLNLPLVSSILGSGPLNIVNSALAGGSTGANSSTAGTGASSTATTFTSNVTVVVKDVLPNGNLLIEGKRTIRMNKQTQTILLEGTVRRDDVLPNNTVLSTSVADMRLIAEGKGLIADRQRQGILTKLLSWVF
jgi:flagellar L-ring protein precursor FlgH